MPRFAIFVMLCFSLSSCEKQNIDTAEPENSSSASTSSRRSLSYSDGDLEQLIQSPRRRLDAIDTLPPEERERELDAIAWDAMETDSKIAHEAFGKMSPGSPEKVRLIQHYAMRLAAQDIEEAIAWAETLENETEKSAALSHIAIALAEADPQRAAHLLTEADIPGRDFEVAVVQVIQRWTAKSPAEAAAWVSQFPQNPARVAGVKIIAERWLTNDAAAAFAWMNSMTEPVLRQEIARAIEGSILQKDQTTRDQWLQHASPEIRAELEQQHEHAIKDIGDNIPREE